MVPSTLRTNVKDILALAVEHTPDRRALVVFDRRCELAGLLAQAYRECLPGAVHLDFDAATPAQVWAAFDALQPRDLVVLVQSSNFRLDDFRIRIELFKRGLKVIEHPHLERLTTDEHAAFADSLAYDPGYFRRVGRALKERVDRAQRIVVDTGGEELVYSGAMEESRLNVGDYAAMKNVGGQFPIGEVFSEPRDFATLNGRVKLFVFGDTAFRVNVPDHPITLGVERGQVVHVENSTPAFDAVLEKIRAVEDVWVRELGLGLNRAFSVHRRVADVGTYERMCGVHFSLGAKHSTYAKPNLRRKEGRFHVDVFAATQRVLMDGEVVYLDGAWCV